MKHLIRANALQFDRGQDDVAAAGREQAATKPSYYEDAPEYTAVFRGIKARRAGNRDCETIGRQSAIRIDCGAFCAGRGKPRPYKGEEDAMKNSRREFLTTGGALAGGALLGGAGAANAEASGNVAQSSASGGRKIKVVVCGGHPGDPEYGCGGTIARLAQMGHDVVLFYLNDGGWPPTSSATRIAEAKKACELLSVRPLYAGQQNGHEIGRASCRERV